MLSSRLSRLPSSPGTVIGVVGLAEKQEGEVLTGVGCRDWCHDNKGAPRRADSSL